ncbi:MAG: hypothetical protein ACRC9Y_17900 [Aeromonas veronii]
MFAKIIAAIFGTPATKKPEDLNDILEGFNTQIAKLTARIEEDEAEVVRKTEEQARLEAEKELLAQDIERGTRVKAKFTDLIA